MLKQPCDSPVIFRVFQYWAYTQYILESGESTNQFYRQILIDIYIFAHDLKAPGLQNAVVDLCVDKFAKEPLVPAAQLRMIHEKLTKRSGLRRLFLGWDAAFMIDLKEPFTRETLEALIEGCPKELLCDLSFANSVQLMGNDPLQSQFKAYRFAFYSAWAKRRLP